MSDEIVVPIDSDETLRQSVDEVLPKHHSEATIPISIKETIEFQLEMDIVPTPGIHQLTHVDRFFTSKLREIWVNQFVYHSRSESYRFTLPHEVGHRILHADIFLAQLFHAISKWKMFVIFIQDKKHG